MQEKIQVLIAGITGKMGTMLAHYIIDDSRYELIPIAFVGPEITATSLEIEKKDGTKVLISLVGPDKREAIIPNIKRDYPNVIILDFTAPNTVVDSCKLYCKYNLDFVMGTTGGDRELLPKIVEASESIAVIHPNMSIPVVVTMDMVALIAGKYPDALKDYTIKPKESHQSKKKDKSGSAKVVCNSFKALGVKYLGEKSIKIVRNKFRQLLMGIPFKYLNGHGWHSYTLTSPDGSVQLEIRHNVNGRNTYIGGTDRSVAFVVKQRMAGIKGKCYSLPDVLQG